MTMSETDVDVRTRRPGPSYGEVLASDHRVVPETLLLESPILDDPAYDSLDVDRYLSREFAQIEMEKVWKRVWQFACREEHIPNVGDTELYEIGGISIVVVRVAPDVIKAYYNVCLHQGRKLRHVPGNVKELRCSFHGFCWNLDGSNRSITCEWDFPHIDRSEFGLPEVRVATWGGFVFINMDPDCEPLEDFLGDLPRHFERAPLEERYIQAHVKKVLRCNWKVAQEAFMDAYHVVATHPQELTTVADANSQYDSFGNYSRGIHLIGVPSPHLKWTPTQEQILEELGRFPHAQIGENAASKDPKTARELLCEKVRGDLRPVIGDQADIYCQSELVDLFQFFVFPNFGPWGAFNKLCYRFLPYTSDPEMCTFETYLLAPFSGERPKPAPVNFLGPDEDYVHAPELMHYARIFDQDTYNMPRVQEGLRVLRQLGRRVNLAKYQSRALRHFHRTLDAWIARP